MIFHHSGAPLGRWKIADFGLARFKELKEDKTIERTYLNFQDPSYRYAMPSLTSPKRAPGSFQAPEVEKQGEKVIGPESDIFSLGGISSRILTFAIGRTKYLHKFDRMRGRETCDQDASNSHTHDFFHRNGGQEINTQVLLWLDDLSRENPGLECWIQPWVQIIKKMLEIDPQKRPEAKNVERVLLDDVLPKIVKGNNSTTPPKSPKRPKRSRDSSPQPPISNKRKCFKVKIPDSDIIQTCFSRSHEYAAFLSPCNIHVISFKNLDRENHWTEKEVEEGFVPGEGLVLDIPASDSAFWRAMAISNDYLIARTADAVYTLITSLFDLVYVFSLMKIFRSSPTD